MEARSWDGLLIGDLIDCKGHENTLQWPLLARATPAQRLATTEQSVVISCTRSMSSDTTMSVSPPLILDSSDFKRPYSGS
jgi:hypothetical protein